MKRVLRIAIVIVATAAFAALGLAYPLIAREEITHATWRHGWFLLLLPIGFVVAWFATYGSDERTPRMRMPAIAPLLAGPRGWRTRVRHVPGWVRGGALVIGVFALARPEVPLSAEKSEERGIDIILVLDLSGSMRAVMDGPAGATTKKNPKQHPNYRPTRLDTAKDVIEDFVSRRKSDRIGVVVFGKAAYVLSPPTLDYQLLSELVGKMELDLIDGNGTAIGDAVGTGVARLRRSNARSKAIVLLTDGDSNAGSIAPEYATHLAKREGVRVYTIQIGNGDVVDVYAGLDWLGQPHYEKQVFPVNPTLLKKMSLETDGDAFVATDRAALEQSMHSILDKLEKTKLSAATAQNEELFPYFLAPAVVLVVLEAILRVLLLRRFP